MSVYIEYAFFENFLLDGVLLWLSLKICRCKIVKGKLFTSACFGGAFALLFPLLVLPVFLSYLLKFSVGFLLCMLAFPSLKTKNERGRYAMSSVCFFSLTFFFGGALTALFPKISPLLFAIGFAVLTCLVLVFTKKMARRNALFKNVYTCEIAYKQRRVEILGFYDSGNIAEKNGMGVCFLSPEIAFELFEEEISKEGGQVRDEIQIQTLGGEKKIRIFQGEIKIKEKNVKKTVYFALSKNMLCREYKILLHSRIFEEV